MRIVAALAPLTHQRVACRYTAAARAMSTLSCPFGAADGGSTPSLLLLQCNSLSPMSDGSVLASYGATSGTPSRAAASFQNSILITETPFAVLATAAATEDFGWGGGRWSSPTVSYRERAFA